MCVKVWPESRIHGGHQHGSRGHAFRRHHALHRHQHSGHRTARSGPHAPPASTRRPLIRRSRSGSDPTKLHVFQILTLHLQLFLPPKETGFIRTTLFQNAERAQKVLNDLPGMRCRPAMGGIYLYPCLLLPVELRQEAEVGIRKTITCLSQDVQNV